MATIAFLVGGLMTGRASGQMHMMMGTPDAVRATQVTGPYRVELDVLPVEHLYVRAVAARERRPGGMVIVNGAPPDRSAFQSAPNHHLVVHVFDRASGRAVTPARVAIAYRHGADGQIRTLSVLEMQAVGLGVQSSHYGNNLFLPSGAYTMVVRVNGRRLIYHVTIPS